MQQGVFSEEELRTILDEDNTTDDEMNDVVETATTMDSNENYCEDAARQHSSIAPTAAADTENENHSEQPPATTNCKNENIDYELAEQHRMLARYEAQKLLNDEMGYDVAKAASEMMEKMKESTATDDAVIDAALGHYECCPPLPHYAATKMATTTPSTIFRPQQRRPPPHFALPMDTAYYAEPARGREAPEVRVAHGEIIVDGSAGANRSDTNTTTTCCETCGAHMSIPIDVVLGLCPHCDASPQPKAPSFASAPASVS